MAPANVDAVEAVYERWSRGEFSAGIGVLDPLVLFVMSPDLPDSGTYLGIERVREYTRGFMEAWDHVTIAAEEISVAGDTVLVAVRQAAVGQGSGVAVELRYFHVWTFRGDKVIRLETFRDRAPALEAAGLAD